MQMKIVATTDNKYLGKTFINTDTPIKLADDVFIKVERIQAIPGGFRFISSNYIIDATVV